MGTVLLVAASDLLHRTEYFLRT